MLIVLKIKLIELYHTRTLFTLNNLVLKYNINRNRWVAPHPSYTTE